ncbi:MAG: hypothetical protein H8F28_23785 [Fibrella sp.]|nr:hypothetical protein [Armatimonadota bacterium]
MIRRVADKLGTSLRERVTFVGGVTTALLLTDPASPDVRPTRDVDVVVEIMGYPSYAQLSEELRERGFQESGGAVICRWHTDDLILDVMPTDEAILGFTNRWYPEAVATAQRITLPTLTGEEPEIHIRLISALCFVATKIEAFYGRGNGDYYASHDLEDVVTVVNGRAELVKEIGEDIISLFVARTFADWLALPGFTDVLEGHLPEQGRYRIVLSRFHTVATKHGGT